MIEMIRMHGVSNKDLLLLLEKQDEEALSQFGHGIPDWQTLLNFYLKDKNFVKKMINDGYEIGFLTKGSLKGLLKYKYGLKENEDFYDCGDHLDHVKLSDEALHSLKSTIAKNWTIIEKENEIKIELTYKPTF